MARSPRLGGAGVIKGQQEERQFLPEGSCSQRPRTSDLGGKREGRSSGRLPCLEGTSSRSRLSIHLSSLPSTPNPRGAPRAVLSRGRGRAKQETPTCPPPPHQASKCSWEIGKGFSWIRGWSCSSHWAGHFLIQVRL